MPGKMPWSDHVRTIPAANIDRQPCYAIFEFPCWPHCLLRTTFPAPGCCGTQASIKLRSHLGSPKPSAGPERRSHRHCWSQSMRSAGRLRSHKGAWVGSGINNCKNGTNFKTVFKVCESHVAKKTTASNPETTTPNFRTPKPCSVPARRVSAGSSSRSASLFLGWLSIFLPLFSALGNLGMEALEMPEVLGAFGARRSLGWDAQGSGGSGLVPRSLPTGGPWEEPLLWPRGTRPENQGTTHQHLQTRTGSIPTQKALLYEWWCWWRKCWWRKCWWWLLWLSKCK